MENIEQKLDRLIAMVEELTKKKEGSQFVGDAQIPVVPSTGKKGITLPELARRSAIQNGQQRVAAIVGYFEKIKNTDSISASDIQQGWKEGKFTGNYAAVYMHRAIKEGLVREKSKGIYDLTQTGEDFFTSFITISK